MGGRAVALLLCLGGLTGCLAAPEEGEVIGTAHSTVTVDNALSWNALSWNALSWNALSWDALTHDTAESDVFELAYDNAGDLHHTPLGRQLLEYTTRCAYPEGDEVAVEPYDTLPAERFPGRLGLAEVWKTGGLEQAYREIMSSCLLAHLNHFGTTVDISVRFAGAEPTPDTESYLFYYGDAVFYGDLEADPPAMYACKIREKAGSPAASSPDMDRRVCDDGNCGVTRVQEPHCAPDCYCDDVCDDIVPDNHQWRFHGCRGSNGQTYAHTFSVWLSGSGAPACSGGDVGVSCRPM